MIRIRCNREKLRSALDLVVRRTMEMDLTWDWPCGVAYYGVAEAYLKTGQEEYFSLLRERVDEMISLGTPVWTVNTCAMGHCLLTLHEKTGDERYLDIIRQKIRYLSGDALRFADRVLQHTVSAQRLS